METENDVPAVGAPGLETVKARPSTTGNREAARAPCHRTLCGRDARGLSVEELDGKPRRHTAREGNGSRVPKAVLLAVGTVPFGLFEGPRRPGSRTGEAVAVLP